MTRSNGGGDFIEDYSSPIWFTKFKLGNPKANKRKGNATLPVRVSGAGSVELRGKSLRTVDARARKAATKKLEVRPKGKLKRKLRKRGKAKAKAVVTFTPAGGKPATEKVTVKLLERR